MLRLTRISIDKPIEWRGAIDLFKKRWARLLLHFNLIFLQATAVGTVFIIALILLILLMVMYHVIDAQSPFSARSGVRMLTITANNFTAIINDSRDHWTLKGISVDGAMSFLLALFLTSTFCAYRSASSYLYRWFEGMPTPDAPPTSA